MKLAVVTTHPIQYQVPWFRLLSQQSDVELTVLFCMLPDAAQQGEGFGVAFQWDIPLLDGYAYQVLENKAVDPSVTRFRGCDTPGIFALLKAGHYDAVIVNGWVVKSCLQTLWACRRLGIPCIVRGESNGLPNRAFWKGWLHTLLFRQYAAFLAIGEANRNYYLDRGVLEGKIFMARYCVDNTYFSSRVEAIKPQRDELRARWNIPSAATVFLFVGKFENKKHPMDLVRAMKQLPPDACALMVGDGELLDPCKALAAQENLSIRFTGFLNQSEISKAYAVSDVLVLPSDAGETWGLVVNEAMASGLPVIVSDAVGCHLDLVLNRDTGWVFPLGDPKALVDSMKQALEVKDRSRRGVNAGQLIQEYSYSRVVEGLLACFEHRVKTKECGQ